MYPITFAVMDTQKQLLAEIECFLKDRKMTETRFGLLAVNDGKFVGRLRAGSNMMLATIDKVRGYLAREKVEA